MSKGLGTLQRKIIKAGEATKTIWECGIPLPVRVAHDEAKEDHGISVIHKTESTWRSDGKPWFEPTTTPTIKTAQELAQLKNIFRLATLNINGFKEDDLTHILPACISMPHVRCLLFPDLWHISIENEFRDDSRGRLVAQVPEEIATGRNIANASISRAISSMVERRLIQWSDTRITNKKCPALLTRWQHYDRERPLGWGNKPSECEYHTALLVLDSRATCIEDIIKPTGTT